MFAVPTINEEDVADISFRELQSRKSEEGEKNQEIEKISSNRDETEQKYTGPDGLYLTPSGKMLREYLKHSGFGDHHIEVYDNWISNVAELNICSKKLYFIDGRVVCFENLRIHPPRYSREGKSLRLTPKLAREQGVTYGSDWHVDVVLRKDACDGPEIAREVGVCIGNVPTMLKSQKCILRGKSSRELAQFGEDPKDPGGYFIVSGAEKVVLLQEQLAVNKIYLMNMDNKGTTVARMTANTPRGTALIELLLDSETQSMIEIRLPSMKAPKYDDKSKEKDDEKDEKGSEQEGGKVKKEEEKKNSINVLKIYRLCGLLYDIPEVMTEGGIIEMIKLFIKDKDERVSKSVLKLTSNIVDFRTFTNDIPTIADVMDKNKLTDEEKLKLVKDLLTTDLFPHLNNIPAIDGETVEQYNHRIIMSKLYLLSIMTARFLEYLAGYRKLDDRDSWSNKRVEGAGRMMESLVRSAWRKTLSSVQKMMIQVKDLKGVIEKIRYYNAITATFHDSFITSNWGVKGSATKNNVAQTLVRDSVIATFAHINTVDVSISRTDRQHNLRMVQNSQWGFIDSVSSPEGENCLAKGSKVLSEFLEPILIDSIKIGDTVMSVNHDTYELIATKVKSVFHKTIDKLLTIKLHNGKQITATPEHLFLVPNCYKRADELSERRDHLCIAYVPTWYDNIPKVVEKMITTDYFKQKLSEIGMKQVTVDNYADVLKKKGLLDFENSSPYAPILARMIGFTMTDGNITMKKGYPALKCCFGCVEDADEFRKDAVSLGFKTKKSARTVTEMTNDDGTRKTVHHTYNLNYTGPLTALFIALGAKTGRKTTQPSFIPVWVSNSSKLTKREFLAGLIGGDGGAVATVETSSINYRIHHFTQSKHTSFIENGRQFMRHIAELAEEFDVKVSSFYEEKYKQKISKGEDGISIRMKFSCASDNIINYIYNIGFRYCVDKLTKSFRIGEYLKYRKLAIDEWTSIKIKVNELYENGMDYLSISKELGIPYLEAKTLIYHKETGDCVKLPPYCATYDTWKKCTYGISGCLYMPIESITEAEPGPVYCYTTEADTHTIISDNGIISHNCGIVKNLSLTAKVSVERDDKDIIRLLIGDVNMEPLTSLDPSVRTAFGWNDKIIVYGKFIGWCNGDEVHKFLLDSRRSQLLFTDVSIIREDDWIYVDVGPSRLVRPLLIVNVDDQSLVIKKEGLVNSPIDDQLRNGALEYISAWEQEYIKVATSEKEITNRKQLFKDAEESLSVELSNLQRIKNGESIVIHSVNGDIELTLEDAQKRVESTRETLDRLKKGNKPYTHCEIDPLAILGVASSLIPWPDHNQAPRNTYQVSMGKQALGIYHSNHNNRFDGKTKILAFPNRPMVETDINNVIGLDDRGSGENVNMAFMAYPYTEEDAFIFKKEFLDNGGFRIYKHIVYKNIVRLSGGIVEELMKPGANVGEREDRYKYIGEDGLPQIGAPLRQGDCVIGKIQTVTAINDTRNESTLLRVGDEGVVDKVLVTTDNKVVVVTVKLRVMRTPEEGDKFAPRNAQKGTIGYVMSDIDMPFDEKTGLVPDIIVNVHSMPSRMTMSYPMEMVAAKHGALRGVHINGGAFQYFDSTLKMYSKTFEEYGFDQFGYSTMKSGLSGKNLEVPINMGPVYFQALKHHVKDKIQARNTGPVRPLTRQPPKGEIRQKSDKFTITTKIIIIFEFSDQAKNCPCSRKTCCKSAP